MMRKILATLCLLATLASYGQTDTTGIPFWNYRLPFDQRVDDLVGRMTLEEKVGQMLNHAPAIGRLGIPAYDWWNEVLHGVARTPWRTTVYPQAIAMAATWDTAALGIMARQAALEGRAVHNKAIALHRTGDRYLGLTYWTPNINIFRDPRWGRGQETYGEDPFLTAMLGKAFVHGLQGDDPKYLLAAACAKHYAVHSGPEPLRHVFNVDPDDFDLWNTYLPAFRELVTDAKVAGVMCAYNAFRGQPCCGSDPLMVHILRDKWKFNGYVTSDCWGIDDFFRNHKTAANAVEASADAVSHGTDIECGTDAYLSLVQAVKDGRISESQIDVSVKRLFLIRLRLGMFDPPSMVPYAQTPATVLESEPHAAHALKMARESIVLLRNQGNVLPLSRTIKKIAVLGPNADNRISILGNYNGTPSKIVTLLDGIRKKVGENTTVVYEPAINFTNDTLLSYEDVGSRCSMDGRQGFKAEYFATKDLSGSPATRYLPSVDQRWQEGAEVIGDIRANHFSARYSTIFTAARDGSITFEVEADDGYRLMVNDSVVIDAWERNRWGARRYRLATRKEVAYKLVLAYWQGEGAAHVRLRAGKPVKTDFRSLADKLKDADAIVFAGGISPQLEGEEMPVSYPGFSGGDRTTIQLPPVQTALMKALTATNKPIVFVMMTGSAIATPWETGHIPAIVNAWYGGQSAGDAIADVLFGDYNPSGRLPVTFYRSDEDLPPFGDYSMKNRTYRYFNGEALYPFGFGLSYTSFRYDALETPAVTQQAAGIPVSVRITNTGRYDGDEVVQLYISYDDPAVRTPRRALKGFRRVSLKAGESRTVTFRLDVAALGVAGADGETIYPKGTLTLSVGGWKSAEEKAGTRNVVARAIRIN